MINNNWYAGSKSPPIALNCLTWSSQSLQQSALQRKCQSPSYWKKGDLHLEALNGGGLASFSQCPVHPVYYDVIICFLTVTQVLEHVQGVSENERETVPYEHRLDTAHEQSHGLNEV